jgi:hypothetical protein
MGSCLVGCDSSSIYTFKLYFLNSTSGQWSLFTNSLYYYTSGKSNTDLTILNNLFSDYPSQAIWKVELTVSLATTSTNETFQGTSSMQIYVNFPPSPGICTVSPTQGNTTSLFTITCNSWSDADGSITNYAFYGKVKFNLS